MNPVAMPAGYNEREHSFIKHTLLERYLEKLFLIVGASQQSQKNAKFCYVDCFAGPWGDDSETLETTSISISLAVLSSCKAALENLGITPEVHAIYVEKNKAAHARLSAFLTSNTPAGIVSTPLRGDFVELRDAILKEVGSKAFCFFFVDPKGYTEVGVDILRPLLARPHSEFLVNFMYDFANRVLSREASQQQVRDLLGSNVDLTGMTPKMREQEALATYLANLRACMPLANDKRYRGRSAYVRILDRIKERPKYHLVYLTSHPRGIVEFMHISEHVDLVQRQVRAVTKQSAHEAQGGTLDLFGAETWVDHSAGHANPVDVEAYWIQYLDSGERCVSIFEFADVLEETGWFASDLQSALVRLVAAGFVKNLDAPGRRYKTPLHLTKTGERLQLCKREPATQTLRDA